MEVTLPKVTYFQMNTGVYDYPKCILDSQPRISSNMKIKNPVYVQRAGNIHTTHSCSFQINTAIRSAQ